MIKLIAVDIDGTLLNSNGKLTERVKQVLQAVSAKGVKVVLATGRPLKGVLPLIEELGLNRPNEYVMTYNGSLVQSIADERVISEYSLTKEQFFSLIPVAEQFGVSLHLADRHAIFTTDRNIGIYMAHESWLVKMPICYRTKHEIDEDDAIVVQKMMMTAAPEQLDDMIPRLPKWVTETFNVVKSAPFYLEILHPQANKGNALVNLANHLNIPLRDVMAIGDNDNDLDMMRVAGVAIAMGNARPSVKAVATEIVATNDEDGVAEACEKYIEL